MWSETSLCLFTLDTPVCRNITLHFQINIGMENFTNISNLPYTWEFEYYYDYMDPVVVDEHKLKYNKCK